MERLDVRSATEMYDVAFVSSIRTYGNLGPFRPINRAEFKGIRLFDLLLRPNQVVCGSTVRKGDAISNLYGNWGVIIGSGDIQQAFPYDATSYVDNGRAVSPYGWRNEGIPVDTQVRNAIEYRAGYNEVDIALDESSIAGLFFGENAASADGVDLPSDEVLDMIQPLNIPMYHLHAGQFYHFSKQGGPSGDSVSPADILEYQAEVQHEQAAQMKRQLREKLLLPPRNSLTAGWQLGHIQLTAPWSGFHHAVERHLHSDQIDQRYFGSMAIYSAAVTELYSSAAFNMSTYESFVGRILPNGLLTITNQDLEHYLSTGSAPEYLGKI